MTKTPTPTEKSKNQRDNTKMPPKLRGKMKNQEKTRRIRESWSQK